MTTNTSTPTNTSKTSKASKPRKPRRTSKKAQKSNSTKRTLLIILATLLLIVVVAASWGSSLLFSRYSGENTWLYIPREASESEMLDSLNARVGPKMSGKVMRLLSLKGSSLDRAHGAYRIVHGETALSIARKLASGRQTPVRVVWTNARTLNQLAERITDNLECTPEQFLAACDSILPPAGFTPAAFPAAFIPDTYEFYWSVSPTDLVERLLDYRNDFWTEDRREQAKQLGLTPVDVATIASIIEEESSKSDERPSIARLYINRLKINMPLQADPTVKFAVGDPSIRRITARHLAVESPYNTYRHKGLPPGPIRVADRRSLEAVLSAPEHKYIYMCAKEDFSGYHNFAVDYSSHMANARRYQAELNRRGIN